MLVIWTFRSETLTGFDGLKMPKIIQGQRTRKPIRWKGKGTRDFQRILQFHQNIRAKENSQNNKWKNKQKEILKNQTITSFCVKRIFCWTSLRPSFFQCIPQTPCHSSLQSWKPWKHSHHISLQFLSWSSCLPAPIFWCSSKLQHLSPPCFYKNNSHLKIFSLFFAHFHWFLQKLKNFK